MLLGSHIIPLGLIALTRLYIDNFRMKNCGVFLTRIVLNKCIFGTR